MNYELKESTFMTAAEKLKVLKAWIRFVRGGFKLTQFTKALYNHLIQHCSFIAHYNLGGFYEVYFSYPEDTFKFVTQFTRKFGCVSVEYGHNCWLHDPEYRDINEAMVDSIEDLLPCIIAELKSKELLKS